MPKQLELMEATASAVGLSDPGISEFDLCLLRGAHQQACSKAG